jgi:acyl transferase domain-containing protein/aryl carrier-like protein
VTDPDPVAQGAATDIAIVGMACRFPLAENYDEYWQNIISGRNCIREVPSDRWDWRRYFGDPRLGNKTNVKWGGFIDDIDKFDPLFFGISPSEAAFIDPQHRLFLEAAWHAVEDAGYSVASLSGKAIGVYAGVSKNDYAELMRESRHGIAPYISTGTVHSILVNRVSFLFNLHGKSEAVDTACSSSLLALHNAIRDIASGDCEAAIVGGVNALLTPTMFISHSKSGMLSPDGQCKTFSANANGYVRSEGVGVLFIKPLRHALRDRDHIHAVIKGTAINHGGRANFLTSPTTEAQAAVVAKALRTGNVDPRTIGYIETHGTGTPLGDPIEINGLKKAFAQLAQEFWNPEPLSAAGAYCALSSAKTNVGHLESASGMAGIIKAIMAMKHCRIPAIRNFERLNPYIELDDSPFFIATETVPWESGGPRRAGVSSFGMGGVNAHVVLEEAPAMPVDPIPESGESVILLSAKKGRLKAYAASLVEHLARQWNDEEEELSLRDVAYTLQVGRDVFDERLALTAASPDELIEKLEEYVDGISSATPAEMAAQWVRGTAVDWSAGRRPRRVPLPTYPFERKRCWFADVVLESSTPEPLPLAPAEPPSSSSTRTLRAADFFIRDHVVQGKRMLPAVAHMELARAAAAPAAAPQRVRTLKDVYWITPVVVENADVPVDVRLTSQGDRVHFEIVHDDTIHSKGSLVTGSPDPGTRRTVDIPAIRSRCRGGKSKAALYALFEQHGLAYGSSFQVIESYVHNDHEILAELRLPEEARKDAGDYVLHPSIMDGVFQTITALSVLGSHHSGKQFVPFHLESAEILQPTGDRCFVYATVNARAYEGAWPSFNATLHAPDGVVLVDIQNLQKRPIAGRHDTGVVRKPHRDIYYRPEWSRAPLDHQEESAPGTLVLFARGNETAESFEKYCGPSTKVVLVQPGPGYQRLEEHVYQVDPRQPADYERLLQELKAEGLPPTHVAYLWGTDAGKDGDLRGALDFAIYGVLAFTQAAFKLRLRENVNLIYVHPLEQGVAQPVHAMIAGFARTLKFENPKFTYLTLGIAEADGETIARAVCAELITAHANPLLEVMYRGGQRYERRIVRESVPSDGKSTDPSRVIKRGGVYVVSGGAGGLGFIFSRYLAEKHGGTILWLGRSAMSPAIALKMGEIEKAGGKCEYFSVDVADREALEQVFSRINAVHGDIHGVIHSAGLIEDAFILRKQRDSFSRVLEPKIMGAVHLDALTADENLGFFLVFSSIAALMPNQGQCDYAAANSFLDSFAETRNRLVLDHQRSGVSLALNWPLWAQGGIRVSAEEEHHLATVFGMTPLSTADGLDIFETSLTLAKNRFPEIHQLIAIDGDEEKIERCLGLTSAIPLVVTEVEEAPGARLETALKAIFAARLDLTPEDIDASRTLGELGVDSSALVDVIQDINKRFDAHLKPTLLFDINTIRKLAAYLAEIGKSEVAVRTGDNVPNWNRSLIDVEQSDAARLMFRKTFQTAAFYLRDHVVDGQYNMPGACFVEMARQAGELASGGKAATKLLNNYWASPLSSPDEDFTAHVHLTSKQDYLEYEVVSFTATGEKHLHAMGQIAHDAVAHDPGSRIDLAAVRSRCDEIRYPDKVYGQIRSEGLIVGPTFQPMKQIHLSDTEALAMLELPEEIRSTIGDYVLNPALLTGVFQAALVSNKRIAANTRWYIPIGMDELEILAPIPAECYVYSRPRAANTRNEEMKKFDLEVCRPDGLVVVKLKGFAIRALKEEAVLAASSVSAPAIAPIPAATPDSNILLYAVQDLIRSKLAGPIGLPVEEIDESVQFDNYGVTSVMVVELNQTFEDIFGPIPKTLFFEYRNITELAEYFIENHGDVLARVIPKAGKAPARPTPAAPISDARIEPASKIGVQTRPATAVPVVLTPAVPVVLTPAVPVVLTPAVPVVLTPAVPVVLIPAAPVVLTPRVNDRDDIAIVSAAGRFPGARNLEEFWDVLREGRDCVIEIPPGRFDYRRYFDADPEHNRIYSKWGGFIDDVDRFDPTFFNISPREAELIDPQERLLLEVVWEMLERAGYTRQRLHKLSDRRVGVYVGALWQPYESVGIEATRSGNVLGPSSLLYSIANRVSYFLDLAGPSMAVDTACSSSLTALHLACQSIRNGESRFAIAAGVNLSLAASKYLFLAQNRFLSTDGRCRSYGAGGDGYVPGEGICAVLLKPLANAIEDADSILAVIKGSAINHGGRTNGYTVPSPKAQANVISQALEQARIAPDAITYIEGHGTGTSLGDPVEIEGLEKALGRAQHRSQVCAIGSVKSNIGHLEAAAGIASTIKVLLQMQNGQLAPTLHAEHLNPNINFTNGSFRVQRELGPWTRPEIIRDGKPEQGRRCAAVSSFGAGGSNAHLVLEEYDGPAAPALRTGSSTSGPALFLFSAKTEDRLVAVATRFKDYLRGAVPGDLHDIAYTLQLGREAMRERLAIVAGSIGELRSALTDFAEHPRQRDNWRRGHAETGRGSHSAGIARTSFETLEAWWKGSNLLPIAEAWVQGLEIDWARLYGGRVYGFVGLPTYPFADERYWIEAPASPIAAVDDSSSRATTAVLHPLLHRNTSDLSEQRYGSTFTGEEFFLAEHRVRTDADSVRKVLPGVAHLEIARAAIEQATPERPESAVLELRNIVWANPIVVTEDQQISIALSPVADDQIDFEIYSEDDDTAIVHSQGRAVWSRQPAPAALDLEQLKRRTVNGDLGPDTVYGPCARTGLVLGPAFQPVTSVQLGNGELLAYLRLPAALEGASGDYVLHPSMMDGALHGSIGMLDGWNEGSDKPRLPFALESLRVFSPCTRDMVAWMRYSPGSKAGDPVVKLDVDLCDDRGNVCVQIHGFSSRVLSREAGTSAAKQKVAGTLLATPVWRAEASTEGRGVEYAEHHVILCELPKAGSMELQSLLAGTRCLSLHAEERENIAQRYTRHALACFDRIHAVLQLKPAGKVLVQLAIPADREEALLAGLSGLLKTATLENPQLIGQVVLVPAGAAAEEVAGYLRNEKSGAVVAVVRYRDGVRQVLGWEEVSEDKYHAPSMLKDQGVYLITGGLGGLGILFATEILARTRDARVVLTGRSALNAEIQARLEPLASQAGRASYRQVDPGDLHQVEQLIAGIRDDYGQLDGILHVAGMIADSFLLKKDRAQFAEVLAPKVTGAYNLDAATRDARLDFVVLFSSIVSALGNPGQADYASANGFMDHFAAYRNGLVAAGQRHGLTRSINWPLWQAGRMHVDPMTEELLRQTTGMQPMQTSTGMAAFHRSLALPYDQLLVMEGDLTRMHEVLFGGAEVPFEPQAEPLVAAAAIDAGSLLEKTQDYLRKQLSSLLKLASHRIDPRSSMEEYGIDSISSMKLTNELEKTFGSLPKTLFFEYRTIRELAEYFQARHAAQLTQLLMPVGSRRPEVVQAEHPAPAKPLSRRPATRVRTVASAPAIDHDPIAIIGLSGRYPQAADVAAFWDVLREGRDCIVEVPKERWDWRDYFTEDRSKGGHHYSKWGGFIEGVDEFDPLFFNISPLEAEVIDPQERLFLQHTWMAIEDAGYTRASLRAPCEKDLAGQVGVYAGVWSNEYQLFGAEASMRGKRQGIAVSIASIANRVSYALDLHGPSMTLDTMCAASLTAIHLACQDLKLGRTSLAIAGGVNINIHPSKYLMLSDAQAISSDGHCRSFGEGGDGYVPAEGVGVVVLKRLSEARRDGDHIYGIIRGSALNHGGRTSGYTVPNPQAQTTAVGRALAESGIDARHISYVETHGTGTRLGDPIEIASLNKAFQQYTQDSEFCLIGSVKSNIGHCESAAGIAGLTKILLQMQHQQIVPSLHSAQLNPNIDFSDSPFVVNQALRPWEQPVIDGRTLPRIAGISSFGAGGSNAHLIVEEYQSPSRPPMPFDRVVILLSARTAAQLQQKARDLLDFVEARLGTIDLVSMAYTLQMGRESMEHRLGFVVGSDEQLAVRLQAWLAGEQEIEDAYHGQVKRNDETVALFSSDPDLRQALDNWIGSGKFSRLLDLWGKGLEIDWSKLYGESKPERMSLPVYPFARQRFWIDTGADAAAPANGNGAATALLHPLLHRNTSDLGGQRYGSTFTGDEAFLTDHQIRIGGRGGEKILPGVAYLEMARAAVIDSAPNRPEGSMVELVDTVWLKPVIVTEPTHVSIALSSDDDDRIAYQIYTVEAGQETVHCRGHAVFSSEPAPARLELEQLERQMGRGRLDASDFYAMCTRMGLDYGPAHRGVTALRLGARELLAELRLPAVVETSQDDYELHPSVMDSALQSALALLVDLNDVPDKPLVPFAVESLRVIAACTKEMTAWVRYSGGMVDIDLCDRKGNVCVQIAGFASRALDTDDKTNLQNTTRHPTRIGSNGGPEPASSFDDDFYRNLLEDIASNKLSVEEAVRLG